MTQKIRLALGTAIMMGLKRGRLKDPPSTAHLMTYSEKKCVYGCAFCPQACSSTSPAENLSRVTWPASGLEDVLERLKKSDAFNRVCLQVVGYQGCRDDAIDMIRKIKQSTDLPISVSIRIHNEAFADKLFNAGAERIGIALDAANSSIYPSIKGGSFEMDLDFLLSLSKKFPGRISTHLIVGLGETEEEAVELLRKLHAADITVALFAFTPMKGTQMEGHAPPSYEHYRRIQLALWRITSNNNDISLAFQTSGCPGCNRPCYNERPGKRPYNYPRKLTQAELERELLTAQTRKG